MSKFNSIIILGPTASGKTSLSVNLAKQLNGEIINADSTQVYKELNIGTAKATSEEMQGIKHHLISFLNPEQEFSVSQFKDMANEVIAKLQQKNKVPIIVGGTGFYIESLLNNYTYANSYKNSEIREKYFKLAEEKGNLYVYEILKTHDSLTAEKLHPNDLKRVIRALEIFETTGKTKSQLNDENTMQAASHSTIHNTSQNTLKSLIIGLNMPREVLYERINLRTMQMLQSGLMEEAKTLYDKGYTKDLQSMKSIGYKELYDYFSGEKTLSEVAQRIKQNTRNYAKRQITWFKRVKGVHWFDVTNISAEELMQQVLTLFATEGNGI